MTENSKLGKSIVQHVEFHNFDNEQLHYIEFMFSDELTCQLSDLIEFIYLYYIGEICIRVGKIWDNRVA